MRGESRQGIKTSRRGQGTTLAASRRDYRLKTYITVINSYFDILTSIETSPCTDFDLLGYG